MIIHSSVFVGDIKLSRGFLFKAHHAAADAYNETSTNIKIRNTNTQIQIDKYSKFALFA